jgi:membrane complex biogenesis BtpA family protein
MKSLLAKDFGHRHLMIGMVHTLALPGAPLYDAAGGMRAIVARARVEADALAQAGFHALLYCNEADMPWQTRLEAETVAAMTALVGEVQAKVGLPFGINMLIDPGASIAIAHATGARFVRAFVTGGYVGDMGILDTDGAAALRLRSRIGAHAGAGAVRVLANITAGFSVALAERPIEDAAKGAVFVGLADAVVVNAAAAGVAVETSLVARVAAAVPDTPVVVGTGAAEHNVGALMAVADAFIVGSSIKRDGRTLNPVDPARAQAFMEAVRQAGG